MELERRPPLGKREKSATWNGPTFYRTALLCATIFIEHEHLVRGNIKAGAIKYLPKVKAKEGKQLISTASQVRCHIRGSKSKYQSEYLPIS